jgi:twinkle protein
MRKKSEKIFDLDYCENAIKTFEGQKDSMLHNFRNGKEPGSKTYVRDLDSCITGKGFNAKLWSWRQGEFNIWTGFNNEGKSQFLIFLCVLKALKEDWKFAFFTPENYPPDEFFDDLIHTITGKTTDKNDKDFCMTEQEYLHAFDRIKNNFFFVYPEKDGIPDFTIEKIESVFEYLHWEKGVKAVIVDPYIKIRHEMMAGEQEHLYASRFMMDRINFTRKNNLSYHLVMHQTTPRKEKDGNYPSPNIYNIKGGGTFGDSCDNVISVWRPNRGVDPSDTTVMIKSDKIKKQKLVGIPSEILIDFDRKTNRYISKDGFDFLGGSNRKDDQILRPISNEVFKKIDTLKDWDIDTDQDDTPF